MNVGTTYTDNDDIMHVGLWRLPDTTYGASLSVTDAVIAWGDNDATGNVGPDNLKFVFIKPVSDNPTEPSTSDEGREVGRFTSEGNFGIGNFFNNGIYEQPTHRLDVIGTARLRKMGNNIGQVLITGIKQNDGSDYELAYIPYPDDPNLFLDGTGNWSNSIGFDCRWGDMNSITIPGEKDIFLGSNPMDDCYRGKVSIGHDFSKAKLTVALITNRDKTPMALDISATDNDPNFEPLSEPIIYGLFSRSFGYTEARSYIGISTQAEFGKYAVGIETIGKGAANGSFGVHAKAENSSPGHNIALYGEVDDPNDISIMLVGGYPVQTNFSIDISDESIKTNIEELVEASQILSSLSPKKYYLQQPENRAIAFEEDLQYGFIAQDVQEILPELVHLVNIPEQLDSTGYKEGTSVELLGIQYTALIPILVAGFQEQQSQIEAREAQLNELQEQLNQQQQQLDQLVQQLSACCAQGQNAPTINPQDQTNSSSSQIKLHQNIPNPFSDQTLIEFELPAAAQVLLEISDSQGRPVATLIDGNLSEGLHSLRWNAANMPSGVYYYSLYSDGVLLSKKMIKL